jgi:hypothetical protein
MRIPMLTLAVLDFRNMVRGFITNKALRYSIFGVFVLFSVLLCFLMVGLYLKNPSALKNLANVGIFAGMLLTMTSFALTIVTLTASKDVENPYQLKMALLSPQSEIRQIMPRIAALVFVAVIPFAVMMFPFVLPIFFTNFFFASYLILLISFGLIFSVLLALSLISILVKFLGRQRGSKFSFMLAALLIPVSAIMFQKLLLLKISGDAIGIFLLISLVSVPILTFFVLKQYRVALLDSTDFLYSKEPVWGQYPWSRFFWRSRGPWFVLSFPVSAIVTLVSPNGQTLIWKNVAIYFTGIVIAFIINDLLEWDRSNPALWNTSPNKSEAMKQLILHQVMPIFFISITIIFSLGIAFHKLNWAIIVACLIPLQFGILNFRYGKWLTFFLTSFSVIFIFLSPIFS